MISLDRTPKTNPKRRTVHRNRPQNRRTTHRAPKSSPKTAHRAPKSTPKTAHRTPSPTRRTSHQNPPKKASCARTKAPYSTGLGLDSPQVLSNLDRSCCPLAVIDPNISAPRTKIEPKKAHRAPKSTHHTPCTKIEPKNGAPHTKNDPKKDTVHQGPKSGAHQNRTQKRRTVHRNRPQNRRTTYRAPKSSPKTAHRAPKSTPKTAHRTPKPSPKGRTSHQNPPERASCARTKTPYSTGLGLDPPQVLSNLDRFCCPLAVIDPNISAPRTKIEPKKAHRAPKSTHHTPCTKIHPKTAHRTPKPSPKGRTSHQNPPERASCARTKTPYSTGLGLDSLQVLSNLDRSCCPLAVVDPNISAPRTKIDP